MPLLRSLAAVLAGLGFMFSAVLIGTGLMGVLFLAGGMVRAYIAASLALSGLAAIFGGWLAARIAGRLEMTHAAALAAVMAAMTLSIVFGERLEGQPGWYAPVVGAVGVAGVLAGGWLRASAADAMRKE
jgi:hypothetical protein